MLITTSNTFYLGCDNQIYVSSKCRDYTLVFKVSEPEEKFLEKFYWCLLTGEIFDKTTEYQLVEDAPANVKTLCEMSVTDNDGKLVCSAYMNYHYNSKVG